MLNIQTFDNRSGGNVIYKALAHPLAAAAIATLYAGLSPPVALYDPDGIAEPLLALYPGLPGLEALFVHDVAQVGQCRAGLTARKLSDLPHCAARSVLIAAFDAGRIAARIAHLLPPGASVHTLDAARLPEALLSNPVRYLDKLNFATNFAFFRDAGGLSTQLVSANYWAGYGARAIRLWLRLVQRGRHGPGDVGAKGAAGSSRIFDRQPRGAGALRPAGVRRSAIPARGGRNRP